MKFLPLENITYKTHLSADEVINALAENVEPVKFRFKFFSNAVTKTFEGKIEGDAFSINRIINYRNSFLPQISGIVKNESDGTAITVKMNLHPATAVFIAVAFAFLFLFWIFAISDSILHKNFSFNLLLGAIIFLFPYALGMGGFKYESVRTKKDLRELFQAKIISE